MYRVKLRDFDGPLDLLLFLIQREELDIFDIPIARITDEYLTHVRRMEAVDLDGVADFLLLAAYLISIKVRMLLPKPAPEASDQETEDPRLALVERLLEYRRYKEAAERLATIQELRAALYTRGSASAPARAEPQEVLINASVYHLIRALRRVLTEAPEAPALVIRARDCTVEQQQQFVIKALTVGRDLEFSRLIRGRNRIFVITTFLAILELIQRGLVVLVSTALDDDFVLALGASGG